MQNLLDNADGRGVIALAGASGSHPALITAIDRALGELEVMRFIFDLSAFDRRGSADYAKLSPVEHVEPDDVGLRSRFTTAAPNIVISGGMRAFARMQRHFGKILDDKNIGVLMLCHLWGYPEQALANAAHSRGIPVFLIDEGPFSLPLPGEKALESSRLANRILFAGLRALKLLPRRDLGGKSVDFVLCTAPGRVERLAALGIPKDKLIPVPPPRFDALAVTAQQWREREHRQGPRRILWLHQPFGLDGKVEKDAVEQSERVLAQALSICATRHEIAVVPRIHPRASPQERMRLAQLLADHGLTVADGLGPLYDDLLACDAAVGFYSSALLEAMVCSIPVAASLIGRDSFREAAEAEKVEQLVALGIPASDDAAILARYLEQGLEIGVVPAPEGLLHDEIGMIASDGSSQVAQRLIAALP
ncbi:hypothetical protein [Croceicoccus mobilis]|uniref:Uncharacterized protein n=1 Tax=Croceicoccus mobilis TaxID=1703339 RepID=A0A917DPW9_9SPHN|nr:hypothetical protein [Croceicoccus mobilis]GGD59678.1 hypothetical protein GCM10010990_06340 [Croceicoccus mobilis]